eukprot:31487-Pelagococcus_subviridis.AAC.10
MEVVQVEVVRDRELSQRDRVQDVRLPRAVLADEPQPRPDVEVERGVVQERRAGDGERKLFDAHVRRALRVGREHAGDGSLLREKQLRGQHRGRARGLRRREASDRVRGGLRVRGVGVGLRGGGGGVAAAAALCLFLRRALRRHLRRARFLLRPLLLRRERDEELALFVLHRFPRHEVDVAPHRARRVAPAVLARARSLPPRCRLFGIASPASALRNARLECRSNVWSV